MSEHDPESFTEPAADRPPTAAEEAAADEAARVVDTDRVGRHFREMAETGADVHGEGQIEEPTPD